MHGGMHGGGEGRAGDDTLLEKILCRMVSEC
jgi:hypothetical protein